MEPALEIGVVELRPFRKTPAREERHRLAKRGGDRSEEAPRRAAFTAVENGKLAIALQRLEAPFRGNDIFAVALGGRKAGIVAGKEVSDEKPVFVRL